MRFSIKIEPSGRCFTADDQEPILNAALRQGLNLPYGCRDGHCGSCKARLLSGEVHYPQNLTEALSDEERMAGIALLCQARALSDITMEAHLVGTGDEITVKKLPCRVQSKKLLAHDVMELTLKLPVTERLQFLAGQYIDILLADGRRRSFSLANAPHDDQLLVLHIRHVEGGEFSDYVFHQLEEKSILRIEGPLGSFYLREDSDRPMIFMAGGTGFAPIKSLMEHCLAENTTRAIHFYWGARAKRDLYSHALASQWAEQHTHIHYTPVLSDPAATDHWQGRTGYVHQAVIEDFADLNDYEVYACGPPAMVTAGQQAFLNRGLEESHYYSDAFEFQTPKPAT
ncbi:MAG: CDP-6-deoxy-delta-3,4-glucoseen reductase [Gammaproteobacteria bacterium]|nr:CDP-6-deoxy-delta-3,4-glucoseen reductase [Gammaproteobacteria bacterium]